MGDFFFSSPKERVSQNMYDKAIAGDIIGRKYIEDSTQKAIRELIGSTNLQLGGIGGDILSRAASAGISPGSSTEALTQLNQEPILAHEQQAISDITQRKAQLLQEMLIKQLFAGYEGLSDSSTFGDLMSGLGVGAQIFTGLATGFPGLFIPPTTKATSSALLPTDIFQMSLPSYQNDNLYKKGSDFTPYKPSF